MDIETAIGRFGTENITEMKDIIVTVGKKIEVRARRSYSRRTPSIASVFYGGGMNWNYDGNTATMLSHIFCQYGCTFTSMNWWGGDGMAPPDARRNNPEVMIAVIRQFLDETEFEDSPKIWLAGNSIGAQSTGMCALLFNDSIGEAAILERVFLLASPKIIDTDFIDFGLQTIDAINRLSDRDVEVFFIYGETCNFHQSLRFDKHTVPTGTLKAKVIVLPGRNHYFFTATRPRDHDDKYETLKAIFDEILG